MTIWNYLGWAWIIWTLFNEGLAMVRPSETYRGGSKLAAVLSWLGSAGAVALAVS